MGSLRATGTFVVRVRELRRRTQDHIKDAGLTPGHGADKQAVLNLLNAALATKLVCAQRYRQHYFESDGLLAEEIRKEFLAHSNEEQAQAVNIGERIVQLGGDPEWDTESRLTDDAVESPQDHDQNLDQDLDLETLVKDDLVAERLAIEVYQELVGYLERRDHTTRRMFERILAVEETHAQLLSGMLAQLHRRSLPAAEATVEARR